MKPPRPCLVHHCPSYAISGKAYCLAHHRTHHRPRPQTPSGKVAQTYRWKLLRQRLIDERPWVCSLCTKAIMRREDIEVDHVLPVSHGGEPYDPENLQLTHMRCNRRKRALPPKPWPTSLGHVPPWMIHGTGH